MKNSHRTGKNVSAFIVFNGKLIISMAFGFTA